MANQVFGALRVWGRQHKLSYNTSAAFRQAVQATFSLNDCSPPQDPPSSAQLDARTLKFRRSAQLQRHLEVKLHLPHRRSLKNAAADALEKNLVGREAVSVALGGNAARHEKWQSKTAIPKSISCERASVSEPANSRQGVDPWSVAPDPWSENAYECAPAASCLEPLPLDAGDAVQVHVGQRVLTRRELDMELQFNLLLMECKTPDYHRPTPLPLRDVAPLRSSCLHVGCCTYDESEFVFDLDESDVQVRCVDKQSQCEVAVVATGREFRDAGSQCFALDEHLVIDQFLSRLDVTESVDIGIQTADCAVKPRLTSGTQTTLMPIQPMMPPPPKLLQPYVCNIPRTKLRRSPDGTSVPIPAALARRCGVSGNHRFLAAMLFRAFDTQPLLRDDWCWFVHMLGCTATDPYKVSVRHLETYLGKLYDIRISPTELF